MPLDDQTNLRREFLRVEQLLLDASPWSKLQEVQKRFDDRMRELWKKHFPKRIFPDHELRKVYNKLVDLEPQLAAERDAAMAEGAKIHANYKAEKEDLEPWLEEIATKVVIRPSRTTWSQFRCVPSYRYDSTGNGNAYASGEAERIAQCLRALDLEVRIATHDTTRTMREYNVEVRIAESERDILRYKPLSSLRDTVKWYLEHGLNVRVFMPGLPHGFEERVGLGPAGQEKAQP